MFDTLLIQDFITLFLGLIVEAFPFVVLGVLVSIAVGLFLKEEWVLKYLPKNRLLSHVGLSLTGVLMPVCECGNVPVVRRFLQKGFGVSHAVTFLLAAPIINPITFWSTKEAFNMDTSVVVARMLGALVVANVVGLLISIKKDQKSFINKDFYHSHCVHDHEELRGGKLISSLRIFREEFTTVMSMLILGAFIAAISQTFIPRNVIVEIGNNPILSVIAMMILAFVISICANVDAFFALTYSASFSVGSIVSFLIFGPMIDIKMLTMLKSTFTTKLLVIITVLVALMSFLIGLAINYFI